MPDINQGDNGKAAGRDFIENQTNNFLFKSKTLSKIFSDWHTVRTVIKVPIFYIFNFLFFCTFCFSLYILKNFNFNSSYDLFINSIMSILIFNIYSLVVYLSSKEKEKVHHFSDRIYIIPIFDILLFYVLFGYIN
ncbi:MAG: hypothetical protein U9P72_00780 [Campylobacterota bacterium]|nr:hypothetical protein [Campylobacterota bacterium]